MRPFGSACILAGGKGSRLGGQDKLYLELGGNRLAELVIASLRSHFDDILVATGRPQAFDGLGVRTVPDEPGFQGPLAGLLSALRASSSRWLYLIAVDMPVFSAAWVDLLKERLAGSLDAHPAPLACVAASGTFFEPFQAFYSTAVLDCALPLSPAQNAPRSIQALLDGRPILRVSRADDSGAAYPGLFFNVNTPEDLKAAQDAIRF